MFMINIGPQEKIKHIINKICWRKKTLKQKLLLSGISNFFTSIVLQCITKPFQHYFQDVNKGITFHFKIGIAFVISQSVKC